MKKILTKMMVLLTWIRFHSFPPSHLVSINSLHTFEILSFFNVFFFFFVCVLLLLYQFTPSIYASIILYLYIKPNGTSYIHIEREGDRQKQRRGGGGRGGGGERDGGGITEMLKHIANKWFNSFMDIRQ